MSASRAVNRYPPWAEKRLAAGVSFARMKRVYNRKERMAVKRAIARGQEPEKCPRSILWHWL